VTAAPAIMIYIDADACPVKVEVYRVAGRHGLRLVVVSNSPIAIPREYRIGDRPDTEPVPGSAGQPFIEQVVVASGMDQADDYIVERAAKGVIVVTADVPLAARVVKAGAIAIAPNGKPFTEDSIGMALATRNLMDQLRSAGAITGGPKAFSRQDRSAFLQSLDREIVRLKRQGLAAG
jgi:uncharacterized protein YaiI (UPF0178 family)